MRRDRRHRLWRLPRESRRILNGLRELERGAVERNDQGMLAEILAMLRQIRASRRELRAIIRWGRTLKKYH